MTDELLTVLGMIALGLVLVGVEVFVIPGLGVIGVAGALSLVIGSALAWLWFGADAGAVALLVSVLGPAALTFAFARSSAGRRLVLGSSLQDRPAPEQSVLRVGAEGRALTPLRPSGSALFGQDRADVVTDGLYVEAGEPLRIVEISSSRILVARIAADIQPTRKA